MNFVKEDLIKPPLSYTGGKYRLLPQILPLFPNEIDTFVDLFGGSGVVSCNVVAKNIFYNELNSNVYNLVKWLYNANKQDLLEIDNIIQEYGLSKNNKETYYKFRDKYNQDKDIRKLFLLSCYCMNYMIRFNQNGDFNQACGNGQFSLPMRENFLKFSNCNKNIVFLNNSFEQLNVDKLNENDFVYLDPPYFLTVATYNENGGWTETLEKRMYELCDKLNENKIKFAMSNVIQYKNKEHTVLKEWGINYNINELDYQYTKKQLT